MEIVPQGENGRPLWKPQAARSPTLFTLFRVSHCKFEGTDVRVDCVNTWMESSWFAGFFSNMREAVGDALSVIEDQACRLNCDMFLRDANLHSQPQTLSGRELVTELGKAMTRDRLRGENLALYEVVYSYLPSLRRIHDALFSRELHQNVKIPPTPPVIFDARIPAKAFWDEINNQVFVIRVDE